MILNSTLYFFIAYFILLIISILICLLFIRIKEGLLSIYQFSDIFIEIKNFLFHKGILKYFYLFIILIIFIIITGIPIRFTVLKSYNNGKGLIKEKYVLIGKSLDYFLNNNTKVHFDGYPIALLINNSSHKLIIETFCYSTVNYGGGGDSDIVIAPYSILDIKNYPDYWGYEDPPPKNIELTRPKGTIYATECRRWIHFLQKEEIDTLKR